MKWFDILKVLGTKSNFSQLDFDNIVIEDDDDCKKRWKQIADKLKTMASKTHEKDGEKLILKPDDEKDGGIVHGEKGDSSMHTYIQYYADYDESIPEGVYCKALELLPRLSTRTISETVNSKGEIDLGGDWFIYRRFHEMLYDDPAKYTFDIPPSTIFNSLAIERKDNNGNGWDEEVGIGYYMAYDKVTIGGQDYTYEQLRDYMRGLMK